MSVTTDDSSEPIILPLPNPIVMKFKIVQNHWLSIYSIYIACYFADNLFIYWGESFIFFLGLINSCFYILYKLS